MVIGLELPDPQTIRRTAEEVLTRPDYQLESDAGRDGVLIALIFKILAWITAPFRWLFNAMEGLPDFVRWTVVIVLLVVLILLITHICYTIVSAVRGTTRKKRLALIESETQIDPGQLEQHAEVVAGQKYYIEAIRLLFRACLLRLEKVEKRKFRPGITNREHVRRYRHAPFSGELKLLVETIDNKWFGDDKCQVEDYQACRLAHEKIKQSANIAAAQQTKTKTTPNA